MKKSILLIVVLAAVAWVGYRAYDAYRVGAASNSGGGPKNGPGSSSGMRVPLVDTAIVQEGKLEDKVALIGSLRPIAEVQVMSKIAGRVELVSRDVGDPVKKGELLAQVEDLEIKEDIRHAEAALSVSRATIKQREAELANANRQVARYRELHEQNLVSRQELDDWITKQQTAEALLELGRALVRQSESSLSQYRMNLENTSSNAPMDGFVSRRSIHPGALVTANTPIMTLVDLQTLRLVVNAVERVIVRVTRGMKAQVAVDAFPGRAFHGQVLRVSPVLDPATRTGEVEIHVENPQLVLRAEMFARVILDLGSERRGMVVPREALVYRVDQSGVFTIDGKAVKFKPVEAGATQQGVVEIVKGVALGERVVTMGASLLKDGDMVRVKGDESGGRPRGPDSP